MTAFTDWVQKQMDAGNLPNTIMTRLDGTLVAAPKGMPTGQVDISAILRETFAFALERGALDEYAPEAIAEVKRLLGLE